MSDWTWIQGHGHPGLAREERLRGRRDLEAIRASTLPAGRSSPSIHGLRNGPFFAVLTVLAIDMVIDWPKVLTAATCSMRLIGTVACWGVFQPAVLTRWGSALSSGLACLQRRSPQMRCHWHNHQPEPTASMRSIEYTGHDGWPLTAFVPEDAPPEAPVLVLMHGGGPDHRSLVPLARRLAGSAHVILPDIRGYGRSVCDDPARHTWAQYAQDVIALLDHLGVDRALVGGAGLGTTISLRTVVANPERVAGLVLISLEDIEDDAAKQAEIAFMEAFAARVRAGGLDAAWKPILPHLSPVIGAMVREALPDADPASAAAAAAIGYDRAFESVDELVAIDVPTLIIPGADWRHPASLAEQLAGSLPYGRLATVAMSTDLQSSDDFGRAFAPVIQRFLIEFSDIFSNIRS